MAKQGPEAKLMARAKSFARGVYGDRLVIVKYHGSQFGEAGVSDWLVCLDGKFGACEWKAPENYGNSVERAVDKGPTVKQLAFLHRVNKAGGFAAVVASVDGFMSFLETMDRGYWEKG